MIEIYRMEAWENESDMFIFIHSLLPKPTRWNPLSPPPVPESI